MSARKHECLKCGLKQYLRYFEVLGSGCRSRTCNFCKGIKETKKEQRNDAYSDCISIDQQKVHDLLERGW